MSSPRRRIETDVMKLLMSNNMEVSLVNDNMQEIYVKFQGPSDTPFQGGVWKIHVELPDAYPYKSPSIGFTTRIFHPNIDEASGSVCLDVINQKWSPMFDLVNIFDVFLPQLLRYPNPSDPLNGEAAAMLIKDPKSYENRVREYVKKYALNDTNQLTNQNNQIPNNEESIKDDVSEIMISSTDEEEEEMMF